MIGMSISKAKAHLGLTERYSIVLVYSGGRESIYARYLTMGEAVKESESLQALNVVGMLEGQPEIRIRIDMGRKGQKG